MRNIIILLIFIFNIGVYGLFGETSLMRQLRDDSPVFVRERDHNMLLRDRLDSWFPNHFVIYLDNGYYLSTPSYNEVRSDFYVRQSIYSPYMAVIPDTSATFDESSIILKNKEVIPANGLSADDFYDIKNTIAWLTILFRTHGSPVPDIMLGGYDEVETYVIVNEQSLRQKIIMPSFTETIKKLNQFYQGYTSYFRMNEIVKMNSRIEFYGTVFIRDLSTRKTDFMDVRFHTNRQNQIDLIMFFIYRDV